MDSTRLLPVGEKEIGELPPLLEDIKKITTTQQLRGKLVIYVVSVTDVIPEDGETCDPLVEVAFNHKTKATKHVAKSLNAEFKEKLIFDADFESLEVLLH